MKLMVFNVVVLSLGYFNVIPYKWSLILWGSAVFTAIFNEISKQIPEEKLSSKRKESTK